MTLTCHRVEVVIHGAVDGLERSQLRLEFDPNR